jgi:hypothetical protein
MGFGHNTHMMGKHMVGSDLLTPQGVGILIVYHNTLATLTHFND